MKIKLCGKGKLAHNYLTIGKVYRVESQPSPDTCRIKDDDGDEITISPKGKEFCGFLLDAEGDMYWELQED